VNLADPANTLGHVFYSEKKYNEDNAPTGPSYVHLLTMDSKVRPNTFYFGWEDLFQGGDNDFEDNVCQASASSTRMPPCRWAPAGRAPCSTKVRAVRA
jgi:Notch-like protein